MNSGSNEDDAYPYEWFFKNPENSNQKAFRSLIKHYIIDLEFWNSPFCWTKFPTRAPTNRNSMQLAFVYVSAILNFVYSIRSGTDQLLQRITFKSPPVLVASNGLGIVQNTRQAETQQQGKLKL